MKWVWIQTPCLSLTNCVNFNKVLNIFETLPFVMYKMGKIVISDMIVVRLKKKRS